MFERLNSLIGKDNLKKLNNVHVLIIGIGGVGGHAFESLVRSNIKEITIVDNDVIDITNLNRQILTNQNNIGKLKVDEAKKRGLEINPNIKINTYNIFLDENNIETIMSNKYNYIIDACDTIKTKILLIEYALNNKVKIISCMGTAKKLDPTRLKITDISKTSYDPLAKKIRTHFKNKKIKVISSDEEPVNIKELGSNSYVPAVAGILCASYVINDIIK